MKPVEIEYNNLMRALLYCPNPLENSLLIAILQHNGMEIQPLYTLETAVDDWPSQPVDLTVILLPVVFSLGLKLTKSLRMHSAAPIITISDSLTETEQVSLLDAGVDLPLAKPYSPILLDAQIRMLLRRSANLPFFSLPSLVQGRVRLDPTTRSVQIGERESLHLTQLEFRLLYTFMTHPEQVIPSDQIVEYVWGFDGESNRELVRGLVQRLRTKLEADPQNPVYIHTEPGIGYFFTTAQEAKVSSVK